TLVEAEHQRPQRGLDQLNAQPLLRLLGVHEGAARFGPQDPTVVAAPRERLRRPGEPLRGLVLHDLGGDEGAEGQPAPAATELDLRPWPVQVLDQPGVVVVAGPDVRPAEPRPDDLRLRRDLELVDGEKGRCLRPVLVGPADRALAGHSAEAIRRAALVDMQVDAEDQDQRPQHDRQRSSGVPGRSSAVAWPCGRPTAERPRHHGDREDCDCGHGPGLPGTEGRKRRLVKVTWQWPRAMSSTTSPTGSPATSSTRWWPG